MRRKMIKITTGPVKSGKSKKLIETHNMLTEQGIKVQVFSSKYSLTSGESIVSRYGTNIKAIPISSLFDIQYHTKPDTKAILIDEFQFLDMNSKEIKFYTEISIMNLNFLTDQELIAHCCNYSDDPVVKRLINMLNQRQDAYQLLKSIGVEEDLTFEGTLS